MNTEKVEKYELWRPVIRPERRDMLERLHDVVGLGWRQALIEILGYGASIAFNGISVENYSRLVESEPGSAEITAFDLEQSRVPGLLLMSGSLARGFVDMRLGGKSNDASPEVTNFTPIEQAIAHEITDLLMQYLSQVLSSAGLGQTQINRSANQLRDLFIFNPEDYLIIGRYTVSGGGLDGRLLIAIAAGIVNSLTDSNAPTHLGMGHDRVQERAQELPIEAEIVLGSWRVPLDTLLRLKPGSLLTLPEADEGMLLVSGRRLAPLDVRFEGNQASARVLRGLESHGKA